MKAKNTWEKLKQYIIPLAIGITLAIIYEYLGTTSAGIAFITSVLMLVVLKAIYNWDYLKLQWDLGETIMYGKPARKEEWDNPEDFKKARKQFWQTLYKGTYHKLIGKRIRKQKHGLDNNNNHSSSSPNDRK